ncbi:MAG: hypothetical protein RID07_04220, partial [Lacipirellulaceae bacterium]
MSSQTLPSLLAVAVATCIITSNVSGQEHGHSVHQHSTHDHATTEKHDHGESEKGTHGGTVPTVGSHTIETVIVPRGIMF